MSTNLDVKSVSSLSNALKVASSSKVFWISVFAVLTSFSAQVSVPLEPVPFTLQTLLVLLTGAFLGSRNGAISMLLYLAMGSIGLPVFAGFSFGFATLFGPTGGYLIAFPFAAFLTGYFIEKNKSFLTITFSMVLASLLILVFGSLHLSLFFNGDFAKSFFAGILIFTVWDILKISAAISIYSLLSKKYSKLP